MYAVLSAYTNLKKNQTYKDKIMNENEIEEEIQAKNLNAPRLTPDIIDSLIKEKAFHKLTDVLTVCVLTLQNGFTVTGESACASPANYNQQIGEDIAFTNARDKIWPLAGYALKQKLYEETLWSQIENTTKNYVDYQKNK